MLAALKGYLTPTKCLQAGRWLEQSPSLELFIPGQLGLIGAFISSQPSSALQSYANETGFALLG